MGNRNWFGQWTNWRWLCALGYSCVTQKMNQEAQTQTWHSEKRAVVHTWSMARELSSQIQLPQTTGRRRNGNADGQFVTFQSA